MWACAMNDFTKEELNDIYEAVMDTAIAMPIDLPSKIQSLIDNYCEHDFRLSNEAHFKCKDCGGREK